MLAVADAVRNPGVADAAPPPEGLRLNRSPQAEVTLAWSRPVAGSHDCCYG